MSMTHPTVFVFVDQRDGVDDPTRYRVLEG